jgi:hypothetical protein
MSSRNFLACASVVLLAACNGTGGGGGTEPSTSEVAASVVSGAVNNTSGSSVAMNVPAPPKRSLGRRVLDAVSPIGTAWAADWSCKGGSLSPSFDGPGKDPYAFTPVSCSVTWENGKTATSSWSGPFTLDYGSSCDDAHAFIELQAPSCSITRTTGDAGVTRDITGPDGNHYAIVHDTNGAGTGWDALVSPAPSDGGVVDACSAAGCEASRNLVINGSHLTGVVSIDGVSAKIWDHTVSSAAGGLTVTGAGVNRVVDGSVIVQHNLARFTATATFNHVGYGEVGCCFPTTGSISTTFQRGANLGKTETLTFSAACGEATLTTASGASEPLTLQHCL